MKEFPPFPGLSDGDRRRDHPRAGPNQRHVRVGAGAQLTDIVSAPPLVGVNGGRHNQAVLSRLRFQVGVELVDHVDVRLGECFEPGAILRVLELRRHVVQKKREPVDAEFSDTGKLRRQLREVVVA